MVILNGKIGPCMYRDSHCLKQRWKASILKWLFNFTYFHYISEGNILQYTMLCELGSYWLLDLREYNMFLKYN